MPRVVCTVPGLGVHAGGPSRTVPAFCEALARRGIPVHLITPGGEGLRFGPNRLPRHGLVSVTEVPARRVPALRQPLTPGFGTTVERCLTGHPDTILHDNGCWTPANYSAAWAAQRAHRPLIVTIRGMLSPWALSFNRTKKQLAWCLYQRGLLQKASVLHATSEQEAEELRRLGLRNPIALIANGIDTRGSLPRQDPRPGRAPGQRRILFLSRVHPKKGLDDLVRAWAIVRPRGWKAVVAGPDEDGHLAWVEELARNLGVRDRFEFLGPVDDREKWRVYRDADLFVLPTHSENFGVVIGEAMAAGLPVITTRRAPWEIIARERCGWWVDDRVEELASALRDATSIAPRALSAMGKRGMRLVRSLYSWDRIAAEFEAVYRWVLGVGSRPRTILSDARRPAAQGRAARELT